MRNILISVCIIAYSIILSAASSRDNVNFRINWSVQNGKEDNQVPYHEYSENFLTLNKSKKISMTLNSWTFSPREYWDDTVNGESNGRIDFNEITYAYHYGLNMSVSSEGVIQYNNFSPGDNTIDLNYELRNNSIYPKGSSNLITPLGKTTLFKGEVQIKRRDNSFRSLCASTIGGGQYMGSCSGKVPMSFREIDPETAAELDELVKTIQTQERAIVTKTGEYKTLLEDTQSLLSATEDILNDDFLKINPEDFKGLIPDENYKSLVEVKSSYDIANGKYNDAEEALEGYKDSVDALEKAADEEFKKTSDAIYDTSNTATQDLINKGIDPNDNHLTNYGITEIESEDISIENISFGEEFDTKNNIYENQAKETVVALVAAYSNNDRSRYLMIVHAWTKNHEDILPIIEGRKGILKGEFEAYTAAAKLVLDEINSKIDTDGYFRDSYAASNPDLKDAVKEMEYEFPAEAAALKDKINEMDMSKVNAFSSMTREKFISFVDAIKYLGKALKELEKIQIEEKERQKMREQFRKIAKAAPTMLDLIGEAGKCITISIASGDFGDWLELTTGKDICTGEDLSYGERAISGLGIILGSGQFWRAAGGLVFSGGVKVVKKADEIIETASDLVRYGPLKEGPLHLIKEGAGTVADTFRSGSYWQNKLSKPVKLYRVYGGSAGEMGKYWSRVKPTGPLQATLDSALDPSWGNTAARWIEIEIPAGETIFEGYVSPIFLKANGSEYTTGSLLGSGSQVYINKMIPSSWKTGLQGAFN